MTSEEWIEQHRKKLLAETPFELVIKFPTQRDKDSFSAWMCEQGEQDWWVWEESNSSEEKLEFLYNDEEGCWQTDWIKAVRTKDGD